MSNQLGRVDASIAQVEGPLFGSQLLYEFKQAIIQQSVFQVMFGSAGERIFDSKAPNLNETILPALLMNWASETFNSIDTYFEGSIEAVVALPMTLDGDFNAKRRVANMFQRFLGGPCNLFSKVPGLIKFGYGTQFSYGNLKTFDGLTAPSIQMTIPFTFDLQQLSITNPYDFTAPLDQADLEFVQSYFLEVIADNEQQTILYQGDFSDTGQTT